VIGRAEDISGRRSVVSIEPNSKLPPTPSADLIVANGGRLLPQVGPTIRDDASAPISCRSKVPHGTARFDPNPTFMTTPPGKPLRRKADDRVLCGRVVTICA
jgi:hypothetical protein